MGLAREPLRFVNAGQQLGVIEADRLVPVGFRDGWKEGRHGMKIQRQTRTLDTEKYVAKVTET